MIFYLFDNIYLIHFQDYGSADPDPKEIVTYGSTTLFFTTLDFIKKINLIFPRHSLWVRYSNSVVILRKVIECSVACCLRSGSSDDDDPDDEDFRL
jgi:hypothetical protein